MKVFMDYSFPLNSRAVSGPSSRFAISEKGKPPGRCPVEPKIKAAAAPPSAQLSSGLTLD